MNANDCHDAMLAYVAGCCDDQERVHIERLLASGDITAQAAYAEAISVMHSVSLTIEPVTPPPELRKRVLKRCKCRPENNYRIPMYVSTALAACLAVALTLTLIKDGRDSTRWQNVQRVMASPYASFARLNVTPVANSAGGDKPPGYGRMLYCPVTKMYELNVFDLAPPPPGRVYELWLITPDKKPIAAGTFKVQKDGRGTIMVDMPHVGTVVAAAITDEPAGGSDTPTGVIRLTGNLGD